ncbi:MAG: DUF5362 family protein [Smithellaceae bacterium]
MNGEQVISSQELKFTAGMINSMRSTKPWTMFLAILGFISVGFMVILGVVILFAGSLFPQTDSFNFPAFMGLFYLLFAVLYFMPALFIFRYASAIGRFLKSQSEFEMESALASQKSFWKFVGILALIMVVVSIIGIIAAFVAGIMLGIKG